MDYLTETLVVKIKLRSIITKEGHITSKSLTAEHHNLKKSLNFLTVQRYSKIKTGRKVKGEQKELKRMGGVK